MLSSWTCQETAPPHIKKHGVFQSFTGLDESSDIRSLCHAFSQAAHDSSLLGLKIVADDDTCAAWLVKKASRISEKRNVLSWVVLVEISEEDRGEEQMKMGSKLKRCLTNHNQSRYNLEIGTFRKIHPKIISSLGGLWRKHDKNQFMKPKLSSLCGSESAWSLLLRKGPSWGSWNGPEKLNLSRLTQEKKALKSHVFHD